jgi:hypothetical protein
MEEDDDFEFDDENTEDNSPKPVMKIMKRIYKKHKLLKHK